MRIITTAMCEDILKIANIPEYDVVLPKDIKNADIAILLSETKTDIPAIAIKLNTYQQIKDAVYRLTDEFNTTASPEEIKKIDLLIENNLAKKDKRRNTKVKVYSKFLYDTVLDMGYKICDNDYDYVVVPDFMKDKVDAEENLVIVASHSNVSRSIIERVSNRYEFLGSKLCMKQ